MPRAFHPIISFKKWGDIQSFANFGNLPPSKNMNKKQLTALFMSMLFPWIAGNGLIPLLPVYAILLGATSAGTGYYLSFSYLALALGTLIAGWLSDKFQSRKKLLIISGVLGIPALWLLGRAKNIWQLSIFTAIFLFMTGMTGTLVSILAGLSAYKGERGKVFGVLSTTGALAALIGGISTGLMVDWWGYERMFTILAIFLVFWPLAGLFLEEKTFLLDEKNEVENNGLLPNLGKGFNFLLATSVIAVIANFGNILGRSLAMHERGFTSAEISSTVAVGGAIALPLPFILGWLSDRIDRKKLLSLCYLVGAVGVSLLAIAVSLWHFWVASAFLRILVSVNTGIGSALVADLVPKKMLGKGMSLFSATAWVAGIIGYASTGYAFQNFGMTTTFFIGALLPLFAIILLKFLK